MANTATDPRKRIAEIEALMAEASFWDDKDRAQGILKELNELKAAMAEVERYERGNAVVTIFSGAGGDDAEDFSRMLYEMYSRFAAKRGWQTYLVHDNPNDHGGYRNISFEIMGKGAYGELKNESGVHRLVRISPFNAKKLRQTSFSLVEVIPKFDKLENIPLNPDEIKIEFAKSSGPGGQNVNKRETAVRLIHLPTKMSVHVSSERSQAQNRERAMAMLQAKIYKLREEERLAKEKGMQISRTADIEWGNQIRSYVQHPYKMVKDHRTGAETSNIDAVLEGDLDMFLEAEKGL
ncbi:MAG TPA: PCRF domain-containing protein [Candidatus Paceibacterota bacterium]|nr:PCRF domain-containing protein [Candidatus Paceibacterota bacterium]